MGYYLRTVNFMHALLLLSTAYVYAETNSGSYELGDMVSTQPLMGIGRPALLDRSLTLYTAEGMQNISARQGCYPGYQCENFCCNPGRTCCKTGCCDGNEKCAYDTNGEIGCCPNTAIQCSFGGCCPAGGDCCASDKRCCGPGFVCCGNGECCPTGGSGGGGGGGVPPPPVTSSTTFTQTTTSSTTRTTTSSTTRTTTSTTARTTTTDTFANAFPTTTTGFSGGNIPGNSSSGPGSTDGDSDTPPPSGPGFAGANAGVSIKFPHFVPLAFVSSFVLFFL